MTIKVRFVMMLKMSVRGLSLTKLISVAFLRSVCKLLWFKAVNVYYYYWVHFAIIK